MDHAFEQELTHLLALLAAHVLAEVVIGPHVNAEIDTYITQTLFEA